MSQTDTETEAFVDDSPAEDIDKAMTRMKQKRPKVHLVPLQRSAALSAVEAVRSESA